jgi:hypothetical protein
MKLKQRIASHWEKIQASLFPWLEEELPELTEKQQQLVSVLELVNIDKYVYRYEKGDRGRPLKSRHALVCAFIAKSVFNIPTTAMLIDRLKSDISLRRICGWESRRLIPSESVFSRAFAEFAQSELPSKLHGELIRKTYEGEIVGHLITDAAAVEAREKPAPKVIEPTISKTIGRPKKGEVRTPAYTRIEKQALGIMTFEEMLEDLPRQCDKGAKTNSKGQAQYWVGYKLHLTCDDHGIPLAALTTSASVHDSQVAIPLAKLTAQRVEGFYDVMDSGYLAEGIIAHSKSLGHVPLIDNGPRNPEQKEIKRQEQLARETLNWQPADSIRYKCRTTVERVFSRLRDEFGIDFLRVRTHLKVQAHLMFGVLAMTVDQMLKLAL